MQKILLSLAVLISLPSHAALEQLNNTELQKVEGQAGADISLKVTLNQTATGQFDSTLCSDLRYCRLAINLNNRFANDQNGKALLHKDLKDNTLLI